MDGVSDLDFFVRLTKAGSLVSCAREIGVTPSTITKRLAALEQRLGVRLLNRSTRRCSLTAEGEAYLEDGSRLLGELTMLEQTLAGTQASPRGLLRVHCTLGFGREHVAPAVSRFLRRYPDVEVQLQLSDLPAKQVEHGFDVSIHIGSLPDARLSARKIAANARVLCAAPAYLRQYGEPLKPGDLSRHRCLVIRQGEETYGVWQMTSGSRHDSVKVRGPLSTNDGATALCWALEGQGILMRSEWDLARYFRSRRLQRVLPSWSFPAADIMAVYPTRQHMSAKTRAFVDHLVETFADYVF
jgi:LysR family transcriptional activator of dmlA